MQDEKRENDPAGPRSMPRGTASRGIGVSNRLRSSQASDVTFFLAPVKGLDLQVVYSTTENTINSYKIRGDPAAISLLNRLSSRGEDASTIRGSLGNITPVTLDEVTKLAAGIPIAAKFFAFAYPLECLAADVAKLFNLVIGSVSRLDDELFFFFLLGGFCYFDESQTFLQSNALSLKHTERQLTFVSRPALEP